MSQGRDSQADTSAGGQGRRERQEAEARPSRHGAAERLSTPDQLDQVIQVARFPHWLALSAMILVVVAALAASVLVPLPVTVRGEGILIHTGGIPTVTSDTAGRLLEILVEPGSRVAAGQVVARVDQPDLRQELANRRAELDEAQRRRATIEAFHERRTSTQNRAIADQVHALEKRHEYARRELRLREEQERGEQRLFEQGIVSESQLAEARTRINDAETELLAIENEIKSFAKVLDDQALAQERELLDTQLRISDLERQAASLEEEYRRNSEIASPYEGRVVELKVNPGEVIERNRPLMSLLPSSLGDPADPATELVAVIYVPPAEGKKVEPGHPVQLALSSVKREKDGFLIGRVQSVAEVPSTTEGMMRILHNDQLVQQLSKDHAPFEVIVRLARDTSAPSGYRWSTAPGPRVRINVGTLCTGDVIIRRERPIRLLLPAVGRWLDD